MLKKQRKTLFLNFMLAALVSIVWIKYKSLSLADSIICFIVVFFVLFSIDVFANWTSYRSMKKISEKKSK